MTATPTLAHPQVTTALLSDIPAVVALDRECFTAEDPDRQIASPGEVEAAVRSGMTFVVRADDSSDALVAFLQYCPVAEGHFHILGVGVKDAYRGRGLATLLVRHFIAKCDRDFPSNWGASVTTSPSNLPMLRALLANGFVGTELLDAYYGRGRGRMYLRAPNHETLNARSRILLPAASDSQLASLLRDREYALFGLLALPPGPYFELGRPQPTDKTLQASEASVSMGLTGAILAAMTFLLGTGLASAHRFPTDILGHLVLSLVAVLMAVLVYGSSSAELARFRIGDFSRHMTAGNALSETGGVYSFLHLLPVALVRITSSTPAGMFTAVGTSLTLLWYHQSGFAIVPRHPLRRWIKIPILLYMTLSPLLGIAIFLRFHSTTLWVVINGSVLALTTVLLLGSREIFPGRLGWRR